jgi:hypothetical protein
MDSCLLQLQLLLLGLKLGSCPVASATAKIKLLELSIQPSLSRELIAEVQLLMTARELSCKLLEAIDG